MLVHRYLASIEDPDLALMTCFWDPFLNDPARYLACPYSVDGSVLLACVRPFLANRQFGAILRDVELPKPPITTDEECVCPSAFRIHVIGDLDLPGLSRIWRLREKKAAPQPFELRPPSDSRYRIYAVHFSGDRVLESREATEMQTRIGDGSSPQMQVGLQLHESLKYAPLLRAGAALPRHVTTEYALLCDLLTDPCECRNAAPSDALFHQLQHRARVFCFPSDHSLASFFDSLKFQHTHVSQLHQRSVRLSRALAHVRHFSARPLSELPLLLAYRRLVRFARPRDLPPRVLPPEALIRVDLFHAALAQSVATLDAGNLPVPAPVRFHFVVDGVSFVAFRASRAPLAVVDAALSDALRSSRAPPSSPAGRWLAGHIGYLDGRAAPALWRAFEENCDPLWKASAVRAAFDVVFWTVAVHFGDVPQDEGSRLELLRVACAYVRPPHIASVFAFVTEFLGGSPRRWGELGGAPLRETCVLLQRLVGGWLPRTLGLWTLAVALRRKYYLAFHEGPQPSSATAAGRFFALLTGLGQSDIASMPPPVAAEDRWETVSAVVPDGGAGFAATVLALHECKNTREIAAQDAPREIAVAVWSSSLSQVEDFFGNEVAAIRAFFEGADARVGGLVIPRVRIVMCDGPDTREFIQRVERVSHELPGVKVIRWSR
jgi:hypothetical protein